MRRLAEADRGAAAGGPGGGRQGAPPERAAVVGGLSLALALLIAAAAPAAAQTVTLDEAVRLALARNASARVADDEIARAEAIVTEVRSSYLPLVAGIAAYTRLEDDRTVAGRLVAAADGFTAAVTVTAPLVSFKAWAATRRAEDSADVVRLGAADLRRALALVVGRAYLAVLAQQRIVEVSERARVAAAAHVDFAKARLAGGLGNQLDEVRAEEELAADESRVAATRAGLTRAREALGLLVAGAGALDVAGDPELGDSPSAAEAEGEASATRADVAAARRRLSAADAARRDDWTDYAPTLALLGQVFFTAPQIDPVPRVGFQAQLALIVPIYDGSLRTGLAREREINQLEAREGLDGTLRQARSEVRTALDEIARAQESLDAARRAAALAQRELDLVTTGYRAGATSSLEVIDAERRARDAATEAVIAEDAARQARLDLLAASGRFPAPGR
jgi:outer membrane protein TolC